MIWIALWLAVNFGFVLGSIWTGSNGLCTARNGDVPCDRPHSANGYCSGHLHRVNVHGEPLEDYPLGALPHNLCRTSGPDAHERSA